MTDSDKAFRISGYVTSLCAAILLVLALATGGSQGLFQLYAPPADYAALLVSRASVLRPDIGIDMLFIAAYLSFFTLWARRMMADGGDRLLIGVALSLAYITGLFDAAENAHILAMLRATEMGYAPSEVQILFQQAASQVKFHAAYCGMAALGLLWTPKPGWAWVKLLFAIQLFTGVGIAISDGSILKVLYFFRAMFFVIGPLLIVTTRADARS